MGDQYLVHHNREKSEIQLCVCRSQAIGFMPWDCVPINNDEVPKAGNEWLKWNRKWKEYFAKKHNIEIEKLQ